MKYLILLGKSLLSIFIISISLTLIITIFSYFNIFSDNITKILKLSSIIISVFISGFITGKNGIKKGYIEGIKLSMIIVAILVILAFIFNDIKASSILYYIIIITSTIFGSMIGALKKVKN